ncbi:hypothetical protein GWK91_12790 [Virgibacillus sp. MSP4-1]|uniref:hypothetical protein n=1 Tax=Virgibacillus sp. MSP4-1 TaxID=2700081 RepID=UPI00039E5EA3|nr:hypothetical protein [Virgibacillus sp. MSP4-1]QHS23771.1 hypothetical protein GWK91_12790 [Virgibacillus sp. MSP4-1]
MLIPKQEFIAFKEFTRNYFKNKREGKSAEILHALEENDGKLYRSIKKAIGKQKLKDYIGRLLRSVAREGWLVYENKVWKATHEWGYCTYCFSPVDEVYLIDIDHHQYCDSDCFDELEAVPHYDAYADDYMFLFWDFEKLKDRYQAYLNRSMKTSFETHLELTMILRDLYDVLNDDEYSTVLFNGGDDGPLAREMYRMLMLLKEDAEKLDQLLEQCEKALPQTNERFAIEISDAIMRKRKRPEVLREFIRTHRKYRNKENNKKWVTANAMQRMDWDDTLMKEEALQNEVSWINEVACPACKQIVDNKWSRRVPDGFFYCDECYEELDFEYDFRRD